MKDAGLQPSDTGAPGGKETGQHMSHYIIVGGLFDQFCKKLLEGGFKLSWQSLEASNGGKAPTRAKFTCPECELNAWAKPEAQLVCGECEQPMERTA
jgi:hypothetical protein